MVLPLRLSWGLQAALTRSSLAALQEMHPGVAHAELQRRSASSVTSTRRSGRASGFA